MQGYEILMSSEETESWRTRRPCEGLADMWTELLQKDTFFFVLKCGQVQEQWDLWGETVTEETMYFGFAERGFLVLFFSDWLILRLVWSLSAGNQICHQLSSPGSQKKCPKGGFGCLIIFSEESICCHGDGNAPDSVSSHTLNNSFVLHQLKQQPWKNLVLRGDSPSPLGAWLSRWVYFQHGKTKEPIRAILPAESVFILPFNKQPSPAVDGVSTAAAAKQAAQGH